MRASLSKAISMNYQIVEALGAIVRDKQVDQEFLLQIVKEGLASAVKRKMRARRNLDNVDVEIDNKSGKISIIMVKKVVDEIEEDEYEEILVEEARTVEADAKVGDFVTIRIPYESFGRNAIQTAKQVIIQRIREAERDKIYDEYSAKLGDIVTGTVQQVSRGHLIVHLGKTEGILRVRDQIRRERYRQGDRVRALVLEVQRDARRDPMIVLSRNHVDMLGRLFTMEVPEVSEGIVEIKAIAREAGDRAKIAVQSHDPSIDPVGACVGIKGSRVLSVAQEFNGEKIDIVPWSEDPTVFLTKALSPARVTDVMIDESTGEPKVTMVVKDDQLSLAIGRAGQNARLAARLTGYRIDIISNTEYREILEEIRRRDIPVAEVDGISEEEVELLRKAGFDTLKDLSGVTTEGLSAIPGIGAEGGVRLLGVVQEAFVRFEEDDDEVAPVEDGNEDASEEDDDEVASGEDGNEDASEEDDDEVASEGDGDEDASEEDGDVDTLEDEESDGADTEESPLAEFDSVQEEVETDEMEGAEESSALKVDEGA